MLTYDNDKYPRTDDAVKRNIQIWLNSASAEDKRAIRESEKNSSISSMSKDVTNWNKSIEELLKENPIIGDPKIVTIKNYEDYLEECKIFLQISIIKICACYNKLKNENKKKDMEYIQMIELNVRKLYYYICGIMGVIADIGLCIAQFKATPIKNLMVSTFENDDDDKDC